MTRVGVPRLPRGWMELTLNIEWLIDHWDQPERAHPGNVRRSQGLHVLAADESGSRASAESQSPAQRGLPADIARWSAVFDRIYNQIMERGWHPTRRAFVQHYDTDVLDASLLLMPLCKFIAPTDPRLALHARRHHHGSSHSDSLVYRYNVDVSPDGLAGNEATFSMCSFWWVEAFTRAGRLKISPARLREGAHLREPRRAVLRGDRAHRRVTCNFPQAFTHLALISAADNLDRALG